VTLFNITSEKALQIIMTLSPFKQYGGLPIPTDMLQIIFSLIIKNADPR